MGKDEHFKVGRYMSNFYKKPFIYVAYHYIMRSLCMAVIIKINKTTMHKTRKRKWALLSPSVTSKVDLLWKSMKWARPPLDIITSRRTKASALNVRQHWWSQFS